MGGYGVWLCGGMEVWGMGVWGYGWWCGGYGGWVYGVRGVVWGVYFGEMDEEAIRAISTA